MKNTFSVFCEVIIAIIKGDKTGIKIGGMGGRVENPQLIREMFLLFADD